MELCSVLQHRFSTVFMEDHTSNQTTISHKHLNMASFRFLLNGVLIFSTMVILLWMFTEQEKVRNCTQLSDKVPTSEPKVIVIQQQVQNNSSQPGDWDHNWDKKADSKEYQGGVTRTLILVRHGQYDLQTGKLTELGRRQANMTGLRLKAMNYKYSEIIYSTLERAVQTGQLIQSHLPQLPSMSDEFIREGGPVPPKPLITYWGLPDRDYFVDGPRLEAAFRKYFYRADKNQAETSRQILVGHGNIFRFFALRALQLPKEAWMRVFIAHASITVIHIHGDGSVAMDKFGDSGHLPPDMVTY